MQRQFGIGIFVILFILWSCDTHTVSVKEVNSDSADYLSDTEMKGNINQLQWILPGSGLANNINDEAPFYGCYFWIRVENSEKGFRHYSLQLIYPTSITQASGSNITSVQYSLLNSKDEPIRFAYCIIPDSKEARNQLLSQLDSRAKNSMQSQAKATPNSGGATIMDDCGDYPCDWYYDGGVWVCTAPSCEPEVPEEGTDPPWEPPPEGGGGGSNPPGGGGPGIPDTPCGWDDPNFPPPPNCFSMNPCDWPSPPDHCDIEPCDTNDPIINNTGIQQVFAYLYDESDFDNSNIAQRREQGGFVIQDSDGSYGFAEFPDSWPRYACGIGMPSNWYESAPSTTVGMVHTHPFFEGDDTSASNICGNVPGADDYQSGFGTDDWEALIDLANHLDDFTIKGYVIDGNNIVTYGVPNHPSSGPASINERCGY